MLHGYRAPEPEPLEPAPDPTRLTSEQRVYAWRLLELTSAAKGDAALTLGALSWLTHLARSKCDLHAACDALRAGCTPEMAVDIFT